MKLRKTNNTDANRPEWSQLSEYLSVEDKLAIFEEYYGNGILLESDENTTEYFDSLKRLANEPIRGENYIVCNLLLLQNKVFPTDSSLIKGKFLGYDSDQSLIIKKEDGVTTKYPNNQSGQQGILHTFVFNNIDSYDKFRAEVYLRFNRSLPKAAGGF